MNKIGDNVRILCIKNSDLSLALVPADDRDDYCSITEHVVQIIGIHQMNEDSLLCLCDFDPHSYFSFEINDWHVKIYDVDIKFLTNKATYISPDMIWLPRPAIVTPQVHLNSPGGEWCVICPKFIQYAATNLPNDGFVCRSCRQTKMYIVHPYLKANDIDEADVDWIKT